jgi:hypothetical protein
VKRFLLCSPESGEGEGGRPVAEPTEPEAPSSPSPALPPAADKVTHSDAKESDAASLVALQRELADEKSSRKKDQTRISELEDQIHALKQLPRESKTRDQKRGWLDGCTLLD